MPVDASSAKTPRRPATHLAAEPRDKVRLEVYRYPEELQPEGVKEGLEWKHQGMSEAGLREFPLPEG